MGLLQELLSIIKEDEGNENQSIDYENYLKFVAHFEDAIFKAQIALVSLDSTAPSVNGDIRFLDSIKDRLSEIDGLIGDYKMNLTG